MTMPTATTQPQTRPQNGRTVRVLPKRVDPRSEQTSGLPWYTAYANAVRALPPSIDDATRQFGDDLYERMLFDPQVKGDNEELKSSILSAGVQLVPAIQEPEREGTDQERAEHALASEIRDFCRYNLDNLQESLNDVLYDLLDCMMFGNRIAEQVYRDGASGEAGRFPSLKERLMPVGTFGQGEVFQASPSPGLFLRALKPKPRRALAFVVDAFANVIGLLARIPGQMSPGLYGTFILEGEVPYLMPREKFLVFTWRPVNGDPRGTSLGRAVYSAWWNKLQVVGEYLRYLTQFAGPSIVGLLDNAALTTSGVLIGMPQTDAEGNVLTDGDGKPIPFNPATENFDLLVQLRNGTAAVLSWIKELIPIQMQGEGQAFLSAFAFWNREISKGILGNTLSTNEGEHNARAAAVVAQDVTGDVVAYGRQMVAEALRDDVLARLVEYNYGPEAVYLTPLVSLADIEQQDVPAMLTGLGKVGYTTHWSQAEEIDASLGLPKRMEGWHEDELANRPALPAATDPNAENGDGEDGQDGKGQGQKP